MWNDRAIWVPGHRTLVFNSIFVRAPADGPLRFQAQTDDERVRNWFQAEIAPTFEPLLDLPIERIALRHGDALTDAPAQALLEAVAGGL